MKQQTQHHQPQVSKYQPIWNALKETGECKITAQPQFHRTIVKMVKNKRDDDTAFLYKLAEEHKKHRIKYKIHGTVIHFTLTIELSLHAL